MTTKSTRACARRKSRINPKVVANIVHLSVERRKEAALEKWSYAFKAYISSLDGDEFDIAKHVVMFITQKPRAINPSYTCEVIPFPVRNSQSKPVMGGLV